MPLVSERDRKKVNKIHKAVRLIARGFFYFTCDGNLLKSNFILSLLDTIAEVERN